MVLRALTALISLPILYFLASLAGAIIPGHHPQIDGGEPARIGLLRGPIHYDLILPLTPDLRTRFAFAAADGVPVQNPRAQYLVVGWGAKGFYTTTGSYTDVNLPAIWTALTGDDAVLHLDVAGDLTTMPGLVWLTLSDTQQTALIEAVSATFATTSALPIEPYGPTDAFYPAHGRFNLFHTCNDWLGETLRAAGLEFGIWTPTPQSITLSARWFGSGQS